MTQTNANHSQPGDDFKDLIGLASEETIEREEARAAIPPPTVRLTRERACLGGLAIFVPILAIVLVTNVLGVSLVDLITPAPTPEIARQQAEETLRRVVQEIEGFREDYSALPDLLAEVGISPRGSWTYSKEPDGRYRVVGEMHGQVVTFESPSTKPVHDAQRP